VGIYSYCDTICGFCAIIIDAAFPVDYSQKRIPLDSRAEKI